MVKICCYVLSPADGSPNTHPEAEHRMTGGGGGQGGSEVTKVPIDENNIRERRTGGGGGGGGVTGNEGICL